MTRSSRNPAPDDRNVQVRCVLLVEDESFVCDVQRRIVERSGFRCHTAGTGREAISQLMDHLEIDVIILDAILPDMIGVNLFRALKKIKPAVKVIVCSGMGEEGPAKAICDAGADDVMPKPFAADHLLERVRSVLERSGSKG